ncbi:MAG: Flp pilus assembly complex ATPase component TadA [Planctomycetia bacterium]|nr:Flp pilus assembly complex ATPase component TadA [Planctomycetia bacterium]
MKVWYNKVNESRRALVESDKPEVTIGRDADNLVVLKSPLVSRHHAVVRSSNGQLQLENVGLNSCLVGEQEVLGGEKVEFLPGVKVRIWPYTLTFETETAPIISQQELEAHLRSVMADLELKIHRKLLERLDLYELENSRISNPENILLLENNIEDVCREMNVFAGTNDALLEELSGLTLRDHLINQLIMERGEDEYFDLAALTTNEFDVPATLVAERETELHALLQFVRERLQLGTLPDTSGRVQRVEKQFAGHFHLVRPHLHKELRKYIILRSLKKDLKDTVFGFGPLQDLIRAPTITEIMVVKSDQIYVERDGLIEKSGRRFISDKVTESIIERIVAQVGRRIDKSQPLVDARLPDGSRVNAIIPPLATRGPCLTIRKFPLQRLTMEDLLDFGSITESAARFLRAAVIARKNILVSGGTGTGKTTLLNILSSFIPNKERIVTIEDTQELRLHQEHVVTLESKPPNVEGTGAYTIRDLVRNALRMRPDRIIVGECRGGEALDMIQAMNTGHDGSLTTVHANSAPEVIERLEVLVLMAADLPIASIHRQLASAINLIVQISRLPSGQRVVTQIAEITGLDHESQKVEVMDIFNFRDGRRLLPTGYLPSFLDFLIQKGLLELEFLYGGWESRLERKPGRTPAITGPSPRLLGTSAGGAPGPQSVSFQPPAQAKLDESEQWFCRILGQELGPMSPDDFLAICKAGQLAPHDMVRSGAGQWVPALSTGIYQQFQRAQGRKT